MSDGLLEGIQVNHDHVDGLDALCGDGLNVLRIIANGQDSTVDLRMQRLDSPIENLGKAGHVRNVADSEAGIGQGFARAASGDQLDTEGSQSASQVDQAGLVADAEQGT